MINVVCNDFGVIVVIDCFDDLWDGLEVLKSLMIGFFKVIKEINDKYLLVIGKGIYVIIFFWLDIY